MSDIGNGNGNNKDKDRQKLAKYVINFIKNIKKTKYNGFEQKDIQQKLDKFIE